MTSGRWVTGATVSVILDVDNKRAYLQNEASGVSAETAALFGLDEGATVDEALQTIPKQISSVGDIRTTVRTDLGDNWLLCNGMAIDKSEYPELAELLIPTPNGSVTYSSAIPGGHSNFGEGFTPRAKSANGKLFVCSGGNGSGAYLWVSDDNGATFTDITPSTIGTYASDIIYYDDKYIAVGTGYSPNTIYIAYSTDLSAWTSYSISAGTGWRGQARIAVHNGVYVVTGTSEVYVSTDITSDNFVKYPVKTEDGNAIRIYSIVYDEYRKLWLTGGIHYSSTTAYPLYLMYATDPTGPWTSREMPTKNGSTSGIFDVICSKHFIMLGGHLGGTAKIWCMTDVDAPITMADTAGTTYKVRSLIDIGGRYYAIAIYTDGNSTTSTYANSKMYTSVDGSSWEAYGPNGCSVATHNDTYVVIQQTEANKWRTAAQPITRNIPAISIDGTYTYIKAKEAVV